MKKEPKAWITINGVHVPIFEGESKKDAVKRAIKQGQDNIKKNESDKEKQIAKNKEQKDKLNNKTDNLKTKHKDVTEMSFDEWKEYIKKSNPSIYNTNRDRELFTIYREEQKEAEKKGAFSNASSGKAVDEVRGKKQPDWVLPDPSPEEVNAKVEKREIERKQRYIRQAEKTHGKKWVLERYQVPESFAANYPNLSSTQIIKKYEEFLKKNRKK